MKIADSFNITVSARCGRTIESAKSYMYYILLCLAFLMLGELAGANFYVTCIYFPFCLEGCRFHGIGVRSTHYQ
jgi:hypothetical protein